MKIAICAGHGGYKSLNPKIYSTPGKRTPDGEPEWEFNNKLVLAFMEEIKKYEGVEVLRLDDVTGKTDIPLSTRTKKANDWKADIYISFHHNANTSNWGAWTGVETFHWPNGKSLSLAKIVHPYIVKAYGLRDRGLKDGSHLWIIKNTKMPSILIEGGFMDSTIDIKKLRDDKVLKEAGIGVAKGVAEYGNLKLKNITSPKIDDKKEVGARKLNLAKWQLEEMAKVYKKAFDKKIFNSNEHADKIIKGQMTIDEAIYLLTALYGREHK